MTTKKSNMKGMVDEEEIKLLITNVMRHHHNERFNISKNSVWEKLSQAITKHLHGKIEEMR